MLVKNISFARGSAPRLYLPEKERFADEDIIVKNNNTLPVTNKEIENNEENILPVQVSEGLDSESEQVKKSKAWEYMLGASVVAGLAIYLIKRRNAKNFENAMDNIIRKSHGSSDPVERKVFESSSELSKSFEDMQKQYEASDVKIIAAELNKRFGKDDYSDLAKAIQKELREDEYCDISVIAEISISKEGCDTKTFYNLVDKIIENTQYPLLKEKYINQLQHLMMRDVDSFKVDGDFVLNEKLLELKSKLEELYQDKDVAFAYKDKIFVEINKSLEDNFAKTEIYNKFKILFNNSPLDYDTYKKLLKISEENIDFNGIMDNVKNPYDMKDFVLRSLPKIIENESNLEKKEYLYRKMTEIYRESSFFRSYVDMKKMYDANPNCTAFRYKEDAKNAINKKLESSNIHKKVPSLNSEEKEIDFLYNYLSKDDSNIIPTGHHFVEDMIIELNPSGTKEGFYDVIEYLKNNGMEDRAITYIDSLLKDNEAISGMAKDDIKKVKAYLIAA